jgi:hypothetical protein
MRVFVEIEDSLYEKAIELADPSMDSSNLFNEALKIFIRVRLSERLMALGASSPGIKEIPR